MTRVVFVTGHEFGQRALEGLLSSESYLDRELSIAAAYTKRLSNRGPAVGFRDITPLLHGHRIPVRYADDPTLQAHASDIAALAPHYLLVVGWSRLVHASVLDIPAKLSQVAPAPARNTASAGCIGMHPTALPLGRGQAPIPWTIIRGLENTALSTFFLEDSADVGALIRQLPLDVRANETAASLYFRFSDLHFHAGLALAEDLARRKVRAATQDESAATVWPRRRPVDSYISLDCTSAELERFVRSQCWPYPQARLLLDGQDFAVHRCEILTQPGHGPPGIIEVTPDSVLGQTRDAVVRLYGQRAPADESPG